MTPSVPRTITDAAFRPDRLDRLASRLSAAYKGLNVLVLRQGAQDLFWKANIRELNSEDVSLDVHHIFPRDWCEKNKIPRRQYNLIVNKTPISYKANRMIGGVAPSKYLPRLQQHSQVQDWIMHLWIEILASHLIPAAVLRADEFHAFYEQRKASLLALISSVMGKEPTQAVNVDDYYKETDDEEMQGVAAE